MAKWLRDSSIACVVIGLVFGCSPPEPGDVSSAPPPIVVASIDGEPVTLDELDIWIKDDLFNQATADGDPDLLHRTRTRALRRLVDQRILEQLAIASGVSPARILEDAIDALPPIDDAQIAAFYEGHSRSFSGEGGVEAHGTQIRRFLEREQRLNAMRAVRSRAQVEFDLPAPHDRFADGLPSRGPENAPVTVVAFTDFACLDCGRAEAVLTALRGRYPNEVRMVYRYVPRDDASFRHGREATEAAICAHRLGANWAFHDQLFANQRDLDAEDLAAYAERSSVEPAALDDCRKDPEVAARMDADIKAAEAAGVNRLPAFLVNDQLVSGTRSLPVFSGLVESARRRLALEAERG